MCIRDRPIIGATVVAVDPDGKTNAKSVGTITDITVSYTHLDVYKRQSLVYSDYN